MSDGGPGDLKVASVFAYGKCPYMICYTWPSGGINRTDSQASRTKISNTHDLKTTKPIIMKFLQ